MLTVNRAAGFTLLEVLVTLIVLAIGMLGLANLQSKIHTTELESYQRAHAVLLLQDMVDRISTNRANAAAYVTGTGTGALGTADTQAASCGSGAPGVARDQCEWSNSLKGSAEKSGTTDVGAMVGARGCVSIISAGIYQVSVVWQGNGLTAAPAGVTCATNLYGDDTQRRAVSVPVQIASLT